ncbi:DUF2071 domain-containing protein [Amycolatopsis pithecellobii]|uniref:DUF2071 domain-containing protein n=1 Tax=Amycolatopsis pithecellobii TaxID=664692 RepID=A0A6N7Z2E6_9PSEU|nr:DUF2071 domain-containing protein [Amycolatopsis pithecellobii]MTD55813.1 hypothetical protein [Amycolatopsis pithecellobii]
MTFTGTPRKAPRWYHATTELDDFAIVSYRVDPAGLARHLPAHVVPETFTFEDGTTAALISAVAFKDRDFRFRGLPAVTMSCGQINYRAYVRAYGTTGVWFFGTSLDHALVAIPRTVWGMPWTRSRIGISSAPDRWRMSASDVSGESHCELVATGEPLGALDGFPDVDRMLRLLTHPTDGWYRRRAGGVGHYSIWHDVMAPNPYQVVSARLTFFEQLGLIEPTSLPHSALVQPTVHFDIHTPPRRMPAEK